MGMALERLPDWPAGMTREMALAYTGVADSQLREWEKRGVVNFRARGPRGGMLALRTDLDAALIAMFGASVEEDMDFAD